MGVASRDQNDVPSLLGVSNVDGTTPVTVYADPVTHRLLVDLSGGSGTVTSVSVVTANGFAGTVANATTTPAITLSTTITGILKGDGTAISAATAGSDYTALAFKTIVVSGQSDIVADSAADTLTIAAGTNITLTTDAATDTLTIAASGGASGITIGTTTITSGTNTRILYDNSGVVGEYTLTGSGTVVAMQTAPTFATSITTPSVLATANDSGALGASGTAFSDLFLASGGVINWATGDVTITHSTNALAFGGASSGYSFDAQVAITNPDAANSPAAIITQQETSANIDDVQIISAAAGGGISVNAGGLLLRNDNAGATGSRIQLFANSASPAVSDNIGNIDFNGQDDGAGKNTYGAIATIATAISAGTETGDLILYGGNAGSAVRRATARGDIVGFEIGSRAANAILTSGGNFDLTMRTGNSTTGSIAIANGANGVITVSPNGSGTTQFATTIAPTGNDGAALGTATLSFSDLFMASGAVINIANGNWVATHTSGILTVTTGDLRVTSANVGTNADSVPTLSSTSTLTSKTLTSPTIQTSPVLAAATNLKFTVPSADPSATGVTTNEFNSGYSSTAIGDLVYLDASATWQKAKADSVTTSTNILGIALSVAASGAAVNVLLQGFIYAATPFPTFTIGTPVYISGATAALVTQTAPTTTDFVTRIVGYAIHADKMYFNPSNDWITHA